MADPHIRPRASARFASRVSWQPFETASSISEKKPAAALHGPCAHGDYRLGHMLFFFRRAGRRTWPAYGWTGWLTVTWGPAMTDVRVIFSPPPRGCALAERAFASEAIHALLRAPTRRAPRPRQRRTSLDDVRDGWCARGELFSGGDEWPIVLSNARPTNRPEANEKCSCDSPARRHVPSMLLGFLDNRCAEHAAHPSEKKNPENPGLPSRAHLTQPRPD